MRLMSITQESRSTDVGRSKLVGTNVLGAISGRGLGSAAVDDQRVIGPYRLGASVWQRQVLGMEDGRIYGGRHEGHMGVTKITAARCVALAATPSNPPVNPTGSSHAGLAFARPSSSPPAGYRHC